MIRKKAKSTKAISLGRTKKLSALPSTREFSALDSAVSELAQQTEALLGKTGEKMSAKPILPKKSTGTTHKSTHHTRAKSFDIIHSADKKAGSKAVLKASHPGQNLLSNPEEKLLTAEASDDSIKPTSGHASERPKTLATDIITGHVTGALKIGDKPQDEATATAEKVDTEEPASEVAETVLPVDQIPKGIADSDESGVKTDIEEQTDTHQGKELATPDADSQDSGESEAPDQSSLSKAVIPKVQESEASEDVATKDSGDTAVDTDAADDALTSDPVNQNGTDVSQNVQIYSDNLESHDAPSESDEGEPNSDKVDIFDTEEYHSTLHDWSKLEYHNRGPVIVLLLLCIVLAAGVYAVVSGVKLPFGL